MRVKKTPLILMFSSFMAVFCLTLTYLPTNAQEESAQEQEEAAQRPIVFCHDVTYADRLTSVNVDYNPKALDFFEIGPDHVITQTTDRPAFLDVVRNLPQERWKTPSAVWPVQSVKVQIKVNGITACNVIYTQNALYSQYTELSGFVMQPISITTFRRLNKTLFTTAIN